MYLKLTAGEPGQKSFVAGWDGKVELDGQDISTYVSKVTVTMDATGGPITATIDLCLAGMDVGVPAEVTALIDNAVRRDDSDSPQR